MTGMYTDPESGKKISTHSMMKTFRQCAKQTQYKYVERLKPQVLGRPLRLGTWMHKLQEVDGRGDDWREVHEEMKKNLWGKLFDEERADIGDLPGDCERLMESYLWHYANDPLRILDTEFTLETEFPDGSIYRCKIDALGENQYGLYVVDRKWHRTLPSHEFRIQDAQNVLYVWCALRNKIPVQGHIWDYGRSKPPTLPVLTKTGLISRWARLDTDYPTMVKFFQREFEGKLPPRYKPKMQGLKEQRYVPGQPQSSPFFFRSVVERTPAMIRQVAQEAYHTHKRMHEYPFDRVNLVERSPDRRCDYQCKYQELCVAELLTGERPVNWRKRYKVGDPLDYYQDEVPTREEN